MLDANDIQVIRELLLEERKHTESMFAEERKHTDALFAEEREHTDEKLVSFRQQIREDMMTLIESEINPKLQILAEGHEALLEKLNRIERHDEAMDRIVILEEAVKKLNKEVDALKKAQ